MIKSFPITAATLRIPAAWKVHWDHITAGRMVQPEIRFESLLCMTMAPDFVLDFGWYLRDEGIRFDLQINRGSFGENDVVFYEGWFSFAPALAALQFWLDRLTADETTRAADVELCAILQAIETRIRHFFIPPSGEEVEEPFSHYLRRLIRKEPASYWEAGSGDAAIQYRNRHGVVPSQLIFMFRDPHGFHIEFHTPGANVLRCIRPGKAKENPAIITTSLGGAPWDIPANQFVSRASAARIISAFIDEATGECPSVGIWDNS
jgi:hypothetical protein